MGQIFMSPLNESEAVSGESPRIRVNALFGRIEIERTPRYEWPRIILGSKIRFYDGRGNLEKEITEDNVIMEYA